MEKLSEDSSNQRSVKITLLGLGCVGKTALTYRFIDYKAPTNYDPTGEDRFMTTIEINKQLIAVNILDTAGQESFQGLLDSWVEFGDVFLLVFALNERDSFTYLENKKKKIEIIKRNKNVPIVLVGNKADLHNEREVSRKEAEEKAQLWGATYVETSAISGENCKVPFYEAINQLIKIENKTTILKNDASINVKSDCCCIIY